MKLRLRMTVNVKYDIDDEVTTGLPEAEVPLLARRLEDLVRDGFQNGVVTDDLSAVVEDYSITLDRLYAP